jgi:hypothetical protein
VSQEVEAAIANLRARLQFMATAGASSMGDKINPGYVDSKPPPHSVSLADEFDALLWAAVRQGERLERDFVHAQVGELTADQREFWIKNAPGRCEDVADRFGVRVQTVVAIRDKWKLSHRTGKPLKREKKKV